MSRRLIAVLCLLFTTIVVGGFILYKDHKIVNQQHQVLQLKYYKDSRTGLCFIENTLYTNISSTIFTYVPCSPEVEALVVTNKTAQDKLTDK